MTQDVLVAGRATLLQRCERKLRQMALLGVSLTGALLLASSVQLFCNTAQANSIQEEIKMNNVVMELGDSTITLQLVDNSAVRDLISRLPLTVELEDFGHGAERIFYLDRELDYSAVKAGSDATAGTVAIYRPWGNVCIFLRQGPASRDLITLGHISEQDLAKLKQAKLGAITLHQ